MCCELWCQAVDRFQRLGPGQGGPLLGSHKCHRCTLPHDPARPMHARDALRFPSRPRASVLAARRRANAGDHRCLRVAVRHGRPRLYRQQRAHQRADRSQRRRRGRCLQRQRRRPMCIAPRTRPSARGGLQRRHRGPELQRRRCLLDHAWLPDNADDARSASSGNFTPYP